MWSSHLAHWVQFNFLRFSLLVFVFFHPPKKAEEKQRVPGGRLFGIGSLRLSRRVLCHKATRLLTQSTQLQVLTNKHFLFSLTWDSIYSPIYSPSKLSRRHGMIKFYSAQTGEWSSARRPPPWYRLIGNAGCDVYNKNYRIPDTP